MRTDCFVVLEEGCQEGDGLLVSGGQAYSLTGYGELHSAVAFPVLNTLSCYFQPVHHLLRFRVRIGIAVGIRFLRGVGAWRFPAGLVRGLPPGSPGSGFLATGFPPGIATGIFFLACFTPVGSAFLIAIATPPRTLSLFAVPASRPSISGAERTCICNSARLTPTVPRRQDNIAEYAGSYR